MGDEGPRPQQPDEEEYLSVPGIPVLLSIACLDGTTFHVKVASRAFVSDVKIIIEQVSCAKPVVQSCLTRRDANSPDRLVVWQQARGIPAGTIELFLGGHEDSLPEDERIDDLGVLEETVLFMLWRRGWSWIAAGDGVKLSNQGRVASKCGGANNYQLVTGDSEMSVGRHYWEVEINAIGGSHCDILIGAVMPGLDHGRSHAGSEVADAACYVFGNNGCLWGHDKRGASVQGSFAEGDRIGVLLDLDAGWVRFYRNGQRCGPGFTAGVTGPLLPAVELSDRGQVVTVLAGVAAPPGAGDEDEQWTQGVAE